MFEHETPEETHVTAVDVHTYVEQLEAERALALDAGLGEIEAYMADLDEELGQWRRIYVITAVGELATLRAELSGPQVG